MEAFYSEAGEDEGSRGPPEEGASGRAHPSGTPLLLGHLQPLLREGSVAVDIVLWHVVAQVGPRRSQFGFPATGLGHIEEWAGFWVSQREEEEVEGVLLRHRDEVGLPKRVGLWGEGGVLGRF